MCLYSRLACSYTKLVYKYHFPRTHFCTSSMTNGTSPDTPIKLSSSPISDYKTSKTFGDQEIKKGDVSKRLIFGCGFLTVLIYVMVCFNDEPMDLFSTEILDQLEEKLATKIPNENSNQVNGR